MLEILFRGKRIDNGEWVYGSYFERKDTYGDIIEAVIIVDAYEQITYGQRHLHSILGSECFRVDPKTVGQGCGLPAHSGDEIFEGDIVNDGVSTYEVRWDEGNFEFGVFNKKESFGIAFADDLKIIGNIHDNPELLGGAEH